MANEIIKGKKEYRKFLNIKDMTITAAESFGDKTYLKYFDKNGEVCELSFNGFAQVTEKLGTYFISLGNDIKHIAILSENRYEWIIAYVSAACAGKVTVPLDKEVVFEQTSEFIKISDSDIVVFSNSFLNNIIEFSKTPASANVKYFICIDDTEDLNDPRFFCLNACIAKGEELLAAGDVSYKKLRIDSSKPGAILFTSGTTGTSKGVLLSGENIMTSVHASANMVDINKNDTLFSVLPFHHTYEMTCGILTPLTLGTTVCINNSLKYVIKNMCIFNPTAMVLVPLFISTIYKKICDEIRKTKKEWIIKRGIAATKAARKARIDMRRIIFNRIHKSLGGKLRMIISGGAALDPQLIERFEEFGISIVQGYGITECSPLVSVVPHDKIKYQSVGIPIKNSVVKIMGIDEDGFEYDIPSFSIGEICVKGPHVMLGYYKNSQAASKVFNGEGFFMTGDYGYLDDDNYLYITGRKKNIIIFDNGKNIYPEEIEEYLYRCELITECVVTEREIDGEKVLTAVVFPDYTKFESPDIETVRSTIRSAVLEINKNLPNYKQIRNVEIKKTEFDKTSTKKILRSKV